VYVINRMRMLQNVGRALGAILTRRNEVRDESKGRINTGSVCHCSVRKFNIPLAFVRLS
jgi:hypothetical protein